METNKYCGNFFLCNYWNADMTKVEGLYDTIILDRLKTKVVLNIAVFLNGIIEKDEDVTFLFIIRQHNNDGNDIFLPLVFRSESVKSGSNFMEASVLDNLEVMFPEEGTYSIELYYSPGKIEIEDTGKPNYKDIISEKNFLNRYMLRVECEDN